MSVSIYVYPTSFRVKCDCRGALKEHPEHKVTSFVNSLTEMQFNHRYRRWEVLYRYLHFDKQEEMLYLPRYTLDDFLSTISHLGHQLIQMPHTPVHHITFKLKDKYKLRPDQEDLVEFLTNPDENFKALSARTGVGKSFCACAAIVNLNSTALVLTAGLINQWWRELLDKTTLRKSDIYVIQGSDSLRKLIGATGYYPKVILASIRTMMMYVTAKKLPYSEIMPYNEFQVRFGIGLKIIDEVHENFFANTIIDVHSNIQHNIYLSASYERSNPVGERIFNKIFPKEKRYGDHLVKRYTTVNMLGYRLGVFLDETKLHTNQGYSHPRYEQWILKNYNQRITFFDTIVKTTLDAYFLPNRQERQKCLFVCSTTDMVLAMAAYITKTYPQLGVLCFYGDDDQTSITDRIDVIVSTIKKSGVGIDIKGLKVAANTISFKALPLAKQLMGRLREIKGEETIFLDYYNYELNSHVRHKDARSSRYKDLAAKYYETTVN